MKTKIIMAIILLSQMSCKSQIKDTIITNYIKKETMEFLDLNYHKKMQPRLEQYSTGNYIDTNGDKVLVMSSNDYVVQRTKFKTPITEIKIYNGKTKFLAILDFQFYNFPIGTRKEFNSNGELIKEINNDLLYKFSVEQVCDLIKKEYDIDLMKVSDPNKDIPLYSCRRIEKKEVYKNDFRSIYEVQFITQKDEDSPCKTVTIDGTTGKILYETLFNSQFKEAMNRLPKSKTQVKVIDSEKKNSVPIGTIDSNDNDNNDNPNGMTSILILILGLVIIFGILIYKYKELHPVTP